MADQVKKEIIADNAKVVEFERHHTVIFVFLLLITLAAFISLLIFQFGHFVSYDLEHLQKNFDKYGNETNRSFFDIQSRLESIKISAEQDLFESRIASQNMPFSFRFLKQDRDGIRYGMDDISAEHRKHVDINLTGIGKLSRDNDPDFYRRIRMSLNLEDDFKGLKQSIPSLVFIYLMSIDKTFLHYPWAPSSYFRFEDEYYTYEFWKNSLPENNSERKIFWTNVYADPKVGFMITCSIPIYDDNKFIAMIAADILLDFLNEQAKKFEPYRDGKIIIFDRDKNIMAASGLASSNDQKIKTLKEVLPSPLVSQLDAIIRMPGNTFAETGNLRYIKYNFSSSPATMLYIFPKQTFFDWIIGKIGFATLLVILCMFLILVLSLFVTHRNMVAPSEKFVNFILDKSEGKPVRIDRKIPTIWLPWFAAIADVFDEKAKLTENLKAKNIELEKKNISLLEEIEARNKSENEKRELERQLFQEEKVKAIGMLASGVAHDFNNQLGVIIGYVSILLSQKGLPPEQVTDCLEQVLSSAQMSADLTRQLLAFARKGDFQRIPINVHSAVNEVVSLLNHTIDKRISVKLLLNAPLNTLNGDPSQIKNVIMNLAINASHAMLNGGMITFETSNIVIAENDPLHIAYGLGLGEHIKITITDTGTGMDKETQKHIFEPFFTTKKTGRGTGLGLAAAMGAIKNHHGHIDVESVSGIGSTFAIILPVHAQNVEISETVKTRRLIPVGSCKTLMVVDDEIAFCRMLTDSLGAAGYTVKAFSDPFLAIKYYHESWNDVELVILDMIMPKISGRDFLEELGRVNPRVKVIISSGYCTEEEALELQKRKNQIMAFFRKPYSMVDFSNGLSDALEKMKNNT